MDWAIKRNYRYICLKYILLNNNNDINNDI